MKGFFDEFKKFILRGNVVDLAVGIVIGAAFGKIVDSMVKDLFMPIIGVLTGGLDLSSMTLTLYGDARLSWGSFLQAIINFVIIGFCMFLVVKGMNRMHRHFMEQEEKPTSEQSPTEKLLTEIRDLLKAREQPAAAPAAVPPGPP